MIFSGETVYEISAGARGRAIVMTGFMLWLQDYLQLLHQWAQTSDNWWRKGKFEKNTLNVKCGDHRPQSYRFAQEKRRGRAEILRRVGRKRT